MPYIADVLADFMRQDAKNIGYLVPSQYLGSEYAKFLSRHGCLLPSIPLYIRLPALEDMSLLHLDSVIMDILYDQGVPVEETPEVYESVGGPIFEAKTRLEFRAELAKLRLLATHDKLRWHT